METNIPGHHLKEEVCTTRPAYRAGRVPKGVKVYTVNNESKYILIQNVPSVGAKRELLKLSASFGPLEDHHILDEYPTEDRFTEVYLIKYKNINSARFAKRKLDDRSFFGGILHVCYAPEHESVQETREKLEDRRKIIAKKIRQHYGQRKRHFAEDCNEEASFDQSPMPSTSTSFSHPEGNSDFVPTGIPTETCQSHLLQDTVTFHPISIPSSLLEKSKSSHHDHSRAPSTNESTPPEDSTAVVTFDLPLPPKPNHNSQPKTYSKYEFARVRSHHASLPASFRESNSQFAKSEITQHSLPKPSWKLQSNPDEPQSNEKKQETLETKGDKTESPVIIRNYKQAKPALKFVPRQAVKRKIVDDQQHQKDAENSEIKRNAFLLGDTQGPSDFPGRRADQPKLDPELKNSYQNTILSIRDKISKTISDKMKPQT